MAYENRYRKPTVSHVAELAGVSVTTVSHVVNGVRSYSPETVKKVREAIAELNYVPSYIAKGTRARSTHTLGVCTNDPGRTVAGSRKAFAEALWSGVAEVADTAGFNLLHYSAAVRTGSAPEPFLDGLVEGLLMLVEPEDPRPAKLAAAGLPVVLMAAGPDLPEGVGGVWVDEDKVAHEALQHLWDAGHRRIAHLAGPHSRGEENGTDGIAARRRLAYERWMALRGIDGEALEIGAGSWDPESVDHALHRWLGMADAPTAVFCANDAIARRLVTEARERGLSVPRDLSVVGVDGATDLTSVPIPVDEIGRTAVSMLLRLMSGEPVLTCRRGLPPGAIPRLLSVAPPPLRPLVL